MFAGVRAEDEQRRAASGAVSVEASQLSTAGQSQAERVRTCHCKTSRELPCHSLSNNFQTSQSSNENPLGLGRRYRSDDEHDMDTV